MKVRVYNIEWDIGLRGIREEKMLAMNLPTEVIVDVPDADEFDYEELALDQIARTHDWLIEECNIEQV